jgi:hypothetical protein
MVIFCILCSSLFGLISASFLGLISSSANYPIHIGKPGYFEVIEPLIAKRPANAQVLAAQASLNSFMPKLFPTRKNSESVSQYELSEIISGYGRVTLAGKEAAMFWKAQCDHFNRCILEGLNDRRAIIFGSVFLKLFKAAYPGLRNVKIYKEEIVELVSIAIEKFSVDLSDLLDSNSNSNKPLFSCNHHHHPLNKNHREFLQTCLKFYYDYVPSPDRDFQFIRPGPESKPESTLIVND